MALGSIVIDLLMKTGSFETDSKKAEKRLKEMEKTAKQVGAVIGTAIVAGATAATVAIKGSIDAMDDMSKAALRAQMPTEEFSQLAYAGELADVALQDLTSSMGRLARAQSDAERGLKTQTDAFAQLGVAFKDTEGNLRSSREVFLDIADAFQQQQGSPEALAAGMQIFGRSFQTLIPLLKDGRAGLEAAADEADRLGITLSTEAGQQAEEFNDNLTRLKTAALGLSQSVAVELLPRLIELTERMLEGANQGGRLAGIANDVGNAFDVMGSIFGTIGNVIDTVGDAIEGMTMAFIGAKEAAAGFLSLDWDRFRAGQAVVAEARGVIAGGSDAPAASGPSVSIIRPGDRTPSSILKPLEYSPVETAKATKAVKAHAAAKKELTEAEKLYQEVMEVNAEIDQMASDYQTDMVIAAGNRMVAETEAAEQRQEANQRQIEDMQFERELLSMTNLERERAIALRYANVDAASAEGQAIIAEADALNHAREQAELMFDVKDGLSDMFVDFISGAKSAKEAFGDFADMLFARALEFVADQAIQAMFDAFSGKGGGGGGGSSGGGFDWAGLVGSFFGGARAFGGPVDAGKAYLVGENGPEMVVPRASGTVVPAMQTASLMGGGGGFNQTLQFALAAPTDPRTQQQIAQRVGFETQRASNRNR